MSVGTKYTAVERVETPGTYACKSCGFTSPVNVIGVGHASANASHLLGNHEAAEETARANARRSAALDVERMMGLVKCPRCQKRNAAWVQRFFIEQGIKLGFVLACVWIFVAFVFLQLGAQVFFGVWLAATAVTVRLYIWGVEPQWEWQRAAQCVRFPPDTPGR